MTSTPTQAELLVKLEKINGLSSSLLQCSAQKAKQALERNLGSATPEFEALNTFWGERALQDLRSQIEVVDEQVVRNSIDLGLSGLTTDKALDDLSRIPRAKQVWFDHRNDELPTMTKYWITNYSMNTLEGKSNAPGSSGSA